MREWWTDGESQLLPLYTQRKEVSSFVCVGFCLCVFVCLLCACPVCVRFVFVLCSVCVVSLNPSLPNPSLTSFSICVCSVCVRFVSGLCSFCVRFVFVLCSVCVGLCLFCLCWVVCSVRVGLVFVFVLCSLCSVCVCVCVCVCV